MNVFMETAEMCIRDRVMQIAQLLASYSLGEADKLRRAMGKKSKEGMAEQKDRFLGGAAELGYNKNAVGEIFEQMAKFSEYGFNKSHSAAYALVAVSYTHLDVYKRQPCCPQRDGRE